MISRHPPSRVKSAIRTRAFWGAALGPVIRCRKETTRPNVSETRRTLGWYFFEHNSGRLVSSLLLAELARSARADIVENLVGGKDLP